MKIQFGKWLIVIATFISLMFVVTGLEAKKGGKPDKPDQTKAECIIFWGQLETVPGSEIVEGCCPNAGPSPAYTMTLDLRDEDGETYEGQYYGQLFMNGIGNGRRAPDAQYKVQFWSWDWDNEIPGVGDIFFQIYGGNVIEDKKNKTLTVSFTDEQPTLWLYDDWVADDGCCATVAPVLPVSFDLLRTSDLGYCP